MQKIYQRQFELEYSAFDFVGTSSLRKASLDSLCHMTQTRSCRTSIEIRKYFSGLDDEIGTNSDGSNVYFFFSPF